MRKLKPLGKGLGALLGEVPPSTNLNTGYIPALDMNKLDPNRYQPRMKLDEAKLLELSQSIKENGIIEPLIVTKLKSGRFEIIAGERRWRAAKLAKLSTVPVVVKEASPQQMLEMAVIENIQRADLNPLEEAIAFKNLHEQFNMTYSEIADKVGYSRPAVANKVRLLKLPEPIRKGLLDEKISEGHAKALEALHEEETMLAVLDKVIKLNLNVRRTEEIVRKLNEGKVFSNRSNSQIRDNRTLLLEKTLKDYFKNEKITLYRTKLGGYIKLPYTTEEELEEIMKRIKAPFRIN